LGDIVDYTSSEFPDRLYSEPGKLIIVEDDTGAALEHIYFTICWNIDWLFTLRRHNPSKRNFDVIHILEDASALLDPMRDTFSPSGVSLIVQDLNFCREMRIGIFPICHSTSQVSPKLLPNIENVIVCNLRGDDLRGAQRLLGTNELQTEWLRAGIPLGVACALIPSSWPLPVAVSYPNLRESLNEQ
jgi:hypothetical protein